MTHSENARRFYIDRDGDQAVVRRVPVRSISPATHQVSEPSSQSNPTDRSGPQAHSRVRSLVQSARRHIRHEHA